MSSIPPIPPIPAMRPMPPFPDLFHDALLMPPPCKWTADELAQIAAQIAYKPNWRLQLWLADGYISFRVDVAVPDRDTKETTIVGVTRCFHVRDVPTEKRLMEFCMRVIIEVEIHEAQEMFRYKGELLFDPHATDQKIRF